MALALVRHSFRGRSATNLLVFLPMSTPEIVLGTSLLTLFIASVQWSFVPKGVLYPLGMTSILIAHVMFNVSFVVVTVRARLLGFPSHLEEAARDLFADDWTTFWKVTFPLILPGVIAAALLAFSLSIDDYVITAFTSGQTATFPLYIFGAQQRGIPVQVNVIGTVIFLTAVGFVLLTTVLSRRQRTDPVDAAAIGAKEWMMTTLTSAADRCCRRGHSAARPLGGAGRLGALHGPRHRPRRGIRGWSRRTASATSTTRRASGSPTPATPIRR